MLRDWSDGNAEALENLLPLVYAELHRQAASFLRKERPEHTLQTTALINEAYLRLIDRKSVNWQSRAHFFAVASQAMRRILVDHAKAKHRQKRGGNDIRLSLDGATLVASKQKGTDLVALDEALNKLSLIDPRQARVVELRFFGDLSIEETAAVLQCSARTVKRDWRFAQAWLRRELSRSDAVWPQSNGNA